MKKWQIAVSILLVFALGTAAGAYGSRVTYKKRVNRVLHSEGTPGITVIQSMLGRLDLSEAQRTSIKTILDEKNEKWETIRQEYEPQIQELYATVIEEAKKELTDEQRVEMEQMSAKVQRRLPPRTSSPPGSSSPRTSKPEASAPPEAAVPPEMSQPFGPKSESDRVAEIMEQLQIEAENSSALRSVIESDIQTQESMRDTFEKSQADAEAKFQENLEEAKIQTEKKLSKLLTTDQMELYRQLRNPEEPKPDDFGFDGHGEDMNRKEFQQEGTPPEGQMENNRKVTWSL